MKKITFEEADALDKVANIFGNGANKNTFGSFSDANKTFINATPAIMEAWRTDRVVIDLLCDKLEVISKSESRGVDMAEGISEMLKTLRGE